MKDGAYDENEWALTGSVDDMIAKVDGLCGNVTKDRLDEGTVWTRAPSGICTKTSSCPKDWRTSWEPIGASRSSTTNT